MASGRASTFYSRDEDSFDADREVLLRKAVADLIRAQRRFGKEPMSQQELAGRAGISYEHLNHVENYRAMVSVTILDRIARSLGFQSLSEFFASDQSKVL